MIIVGCVSYAQGLKNNGAFIRGSTGSYLSFQGGGDMVIDNTWPGRLELDNMRVDFTGSGQYHLTLKDDSYLTVNGHLILADSLLLPASSGGMASLITRGTVTGNLACVEQYLTQDRWHLVSSPLSNALSGVYSGIYLKYFKEPDSTWNYIVATNIPLTAGKGYAAWSASGMTGNATVRFKGTLNTGDISPAITYNPGAGMGDGWNLIGNPYPSGLEWNTSWTRSKVDATMYVYDGSQYLTWNCNLGGYGTKGNGDIPSTQGFWIKANASGPSITIPNSERIHSPQSFYKHGESREDLNNLLTFKVEGNGYSDVTIMGFHPQATDSFDSDYDAYKIFGIYDAPQLYSIIPGYDLSVNIMCRVHHRRTVLVGLKVGAEKQYRLTMTGQVNMSVGYRVFLEDLLQPLANLTELKLNSPFFFQARPQDEPERFLVHFIDMFIDDPLPPDAGPEALVYAWEKNVYIWIPGEDNSRPEAIVYDMLGHPVASGFITTGTLNKLPVREKSGNYVVIIRNSHYICPHKVFIR